MVKLKLGDKVRIKESYYYSSFCKSKGLANLLKKKPNGMIIEEDLEDSFNLPLVKLEIGKTIYIFEEYLEKIKSSREFNYND